MEIKFCKNRINLIHSFGLSRSSNDYYDIIYVYILDGDIIARGEAAPSKRYKESSELILSVLNRGIKVPESSNSKEHLWGYLKPQLKGISSLEAAVNMAVWDWRAQKEETPLFNLFGFKDEILPKTSYTIAIGELNEIDEKLEESEKCSILKVKLGTPDKDKEIIRRIRKKTDKLIRVDANEGWDYEMAKSMAFWLADRNVEFIEQPFSVVNLKDTKRLKSVSPLPLIADENSISSNDLNGLVDFFDGINIKLMKCGSFDEALKMIGLAKNLKFKIMLGCMVESSVGITAAAHLSSACDFIDLDGNLLIKDDPYDGVKIENGHLKLSPLKEGLGLNLKQKKIGLL
ncbi:MAG: dipeptide epimerase [Candidatus Neomarinimicrobiota bacterium]